MEKTSENDIPQWEKDIIDERLQYLKDHPEEGISIEALFNKLNSLDINTE